MIKKNISNEIMLESNINYIQTNTTEIENGLYQIDISFKGDDDDGWMKPVVLNITIPLRNIHCLWTPLVGADRALSTNFRLRQVSLSVGAPLICFYSMDGINSFSIALSDALNPVSYEGEVIEETCCYDMKIKLFKDVLLKQNECAFSIRIDKRAVQVGRTIQEMKLWWEAFKGYLPITVPESAYMPMYSTWYSFHQAITTDNMLQQCSIAKDMGMKAIIVDDGWQTIDGNRGYAYCGDWEVCKEKIPDMVKFVNACHAMGIKVLLWYSVSLIGYKSHRWNEFKDMLLKEDYNNQGCGILDPRYKKVREYITTTYVKAVKDWNLDGLKLDFIDQFRMYDETKKYEKGMDIENLADAVDVLLKGIINGLKAVKPDIMIEFRQFYIGPAMSGYGNIFRAVDCPMDPYTNRLRIHDLRLMSEGTAVHSDMIRWNDGDSDESVFINLWSIVFSVPQISVDLVQLSEPQRKILKDFLEFSINHRDVLFKGSFEAQQMQSGYTQAKATKGKECIHAIYQNVPVELNMQALDHYTIINLTCNKLFIENTGHAFLAEVECIDIYGDVILKDIITIPEGPYMFDSCRRGLCKITKL